MLMAISKAIQNFISSLIFLKKKKSSCT